MSTQAGRRVAISAGSLAVLLGALDTYVVVTIMRDIMGDVGIPINQLQRITWIVTMYLLGYIAAMPLLGRASDRFGRKMVLQASLALFILGSVVTALAGHFGDFHLLIAGRTIQGVASGALLPVTLALGADLWAQRNRAGVLGGIGAAQELGSVLGPLYGIFIVFLFHDWRYVFWINVPLTLIAMAMIQFSLPSHERTDAPEKIDLVGGVLLAVALGLAVIGLYNPQPDGKQVLPSYGLPLVIGAIVAAVAFFVWERYSRTRLIEPAGVHFRPFLAALGASVAAGAALMVTLVNVELFGQGVLGMDQNQAAGMLLWFLIALPIGAVLGGWIATRAGDRAMTFIGLLIAAYGYWLISHWPVDLMERSPQHLRIVHRARNAHRLAGGRSRTWPGDRATDLGRPAGCPGCATWHRLGGRGGGPDDGHADRCGRAQRVGLVPVQPDRGGAVGQDPSQRHPAGTTGRPGNDVHQSVRNDVRRHLQGHRRRLCGRSAAGPADQWPQRTRRRTGTPRAAGRRAG